MKYLPSDFKPRKHDVLCGKGNCCRDHTGNIRFRAIIQDHLEEYSATTSKVGKSHVVSKILEEIEQASAEDRGAHHKNIFVKFDSKTKCWFEVAKPVCREKVGSTIRDLLHTQYRSSNEAKRVRRQAQMTKMKEMRVAQQQRHHEQQMGVVLRKMDSLSESVDFPNVSNGELLQRLTQTNLDILKTLEAMRAPQPADVDGDKPPQRPASPNTSASSGSAASSQEGQNPPRSSTSKTCTRLRGVDDYDGAVKPATPGKEVPTAPTTQKSQGPVKPPPPKHPALPKPVKQRKAPAPADSFQSCDSLLSALSEMSISVGTVKSEFSAFGSILEEESTADGNTAHQKAVKV